MEGGGGSKRREVKKDSQRKEQRRRALGLTYKGRYTNGEEVFAWSHGQEEAFRLPREGKKEA